MDRQLNLNLNTKQIVAGLKQVDSSLKKTQKTGMNTNQMVQKATDNTTKSFGRLKGALVGIISLQATFSFAKTIAEFQSLRTTLGVVFQDVERGTQVFKDIQDIAGATPFSVQALTNSVIKLRAAGIEPTTAQLTLFSDVASVTTDKVGTLNAMTDLFSRTTAGGLGLEDLNRLADRGIPVFDILSQKMGLARLEVAEFGKSADGAKEILKTLTDEMEVRFGGASATAAKELGVSISNLGIAWDGFQDSLGAAGGLAIATGLVVGFTSVVDFMATNLDTVAIVMGGLSTLAIPALIGGIKALTTAMMANPIGLLVVGITAAAAAIWHFRDDIYQALVKTFEVTIPNAIDSANIAFLKMKRGVGDLMNDILSKINEFGNNLITSAPEWLQGLLGINGNTFSLGIDISEVNRQIDELEATITGRINNFVPPESIGKTVADSMTGAAGLSTSGSLTGDSVSGGGTGGGLGDTSQTESQLEAFQQSLMSEEELMFQSFDRRQLMIQDANAFKLISDTEVNELLAANNEMFAAQEIALAKKTAMAKSALMQTNLNVTASFLGSMASLTSREGKKKNKIEKALAKASIIASTASSIMKAANNTWPVPAIPLMAAAAAQGAVQLRAVGGSAPTASTTTPVSSASSLAATPLATPTQVETRGETVIQLHGNFYGWDDQVIDELVEGIASAVDDRDVRLISPTSRNAEDLGVST